MGIEVILINLAISAAVSAAAHGVGKLMAKKPDTDTRTVQPKVTSPDPFNDFQGAGGPLPGLFGHRRIGGKSLVQAKFDDVTYVVYVIAGAPVTGIDAVYIDNQLVTIDGSNNVTSEPWANSGSYSMKVFLHDGTQTTANSTLTAELPNWLSSYIGQNIAYAVVRIDPGVSPTKFADTYSSGIPDFSFYVRGFKCYDPRIGGHILGDETTYAFSSNPSIIEANYLIHELGLGLEGGRIDWSSVTTSANVDDEAVTLAAGGTERRYTASLYFTTDESHENVLSRIGAAHAGGIRPIGSAFKMMHGSIPASSATITPDTYAGDGLIVTEKTPISGRFNGVRGKFCSPQDGFEERDFPSYRDATAFTLDNSKEEWLELDLTCVNSHTQAQRLARIAYQRSRYGYKASVTTTMAHFDVTADDLITITDPLAGLDAVTFRVQNEQLNDDYTCSFDLTFENSATMFTWNAATDEQAYTSSPPVEGELGAIVPPGVAMIDTVTPGGAIVPNFKIWASPSQIPGADQYNFRNHMNASLWNAAFPAAQTVSATAVGPAAAINGTWKLEIEDVNNNILTEATVVLPGGTVGGAISDLTVATTPYYQMPGGPTPVIISQVTGRVTLFVADVTDCTRATDITLFRNTTNNYGAAVLQATQAVSAAGNTFTVTGTPGSIMFLWSVLYNSIDVKLGYPSRPVLVVF